MAKVFVEDNELTDIASAIREKNGTEETYKPSEMGSAIRAIESGGSDEVYKHLLGVYTGETTEFYNEDLVETVVGAFYGDTVLKSITLPNLKTTHGSTFNRTVAESISVPCLTSCGTNEIYYCDKLVTFYAPLLEVNVTFTFYQCVRLVDFKISSFSKEYNISIASSALLSDESIQNIIDALETVPSNVTNRKLTFHSDIVSKLTEEQVSQIADKNWILG